MCKCFVEGLAKKGGWGGHQMFCPPSVACSIAQLGLKS